jgi:hypothetical protein
MSFKNPERSFSFIECPHRDYIPVFDFSLTDKERNYLESCYPSDWNPVAIGKADVRAKEYHPRYLINIMKNINYRA